jgi:hypothetical protein
MLVASSSTRHFAGQECKTVITFILSLVFRVTKITAVNPKVMTIQRNPHLTCLDLTFSQIYTELQGFQVNILNAKPLPLKIFSITAYKTTVPPPPPQKKIKWGFQCKRT